MSAHIETLQEIYAAFGRGDVPGVLARLAPDVEWEHDWGMEPLPLDRPRRGREAVAGFFVALADFEFLHFEPFDFLAGETRVVTLIRIHLRHTATRREFRDLEAHLWSFGPDGLVSSFRHLTDTRQLAWASGLA